MSSTTIVSATYPVIDTTKISLIEPADNIESEIYERWIGDLDKYLVSSPKGDCLIFGAELNYFNPKDEIEYLSTLVKHLVKTKASFGWVNMILMTQWEQAKESYVYEIGYGTFREMKIPFLFSELGKDVPRGI